MQYFTFIRRFIVIISIFLLVISFVFARYYKVDQVNAEQEIQAVESFIKQDTTTTEFIGKLEKKVPNLEVSSQEFTKKTMFDSKLSD